MGNLGSWITNSLCPEEQVLWLTAKNGDEQLLRAALARMTPATRQYLEWVDPVYGQTALANAAQNGHVNCVCALIEAGANVNARALKGYTPLLLAAKQGCAAVIQALVENPNVDIFAQNLAGRTALDILRHEYRSSELSQRFVPCLEHIEKKLCTYSGWLYKTGDNLFSLAAGLSSLTSWKKRYCMVLRTADPAVVEIDLFSMKPGERRPACPSLELLYRPQDGVQTTVDNKWFNRKEHTFSIMASLKGDRIRAPQSFELAAQNQHELASWIAFFTSLRNGVQAAIPHAVPSVRVAAPMASNLHTTSVRVHPSNPSCASEVLSPASQERQDIQRAMAMSLQDAHTHSHTAATITMPSAPPASAASMYIHANTPSSPPMTLAPDGVEIVQPLYSQPSGGAVAPAKAVSEEAKEEDAETNGECVVCFDGPQAAVCVPCGHNAVCMDCATELLRTTKACPVCRVQVREIIRLFRV